MGTLIGLEPPAPRLVTEVERRFGVRLTLEQAQRAAAAEMRYYRAHLQEGCDVASVDALRGRCAQALRRALPQDAQRRLDDGVALTEALLASLDFAVYDDAPEALRAARRDGVRVIVVSNWDALLGDVLTRVGLEPLLDGVVASASAGARKPDPAIFRSALALAGVAADEALHVGDSLEDDVAGASAAGVEPLWLNRDGRERPPGVAAIASLRELGPRLLTVGDP